MSGHEVHPFILAGGSGTRLWPLSRKSLPKQFLPLVPGGEGKTLLQHAVMRVAREPFAPAVILGHDDHRFLIGEQLRQLGSDNHGIVLEPVARNTAPAALVAALLREADDIILLMPSDHHIPDFEAFTNAVEVAMPEVERGSVVTFGIVPSEPATGYGYIQAEGNGGVMPVRAFTEKPDAETARRFLEEGGYYWNAGIFMFRAATMIEAFRAHAPEFLEPCAAAVEQAERGEDFIRLRKDAYEQCPSDSLDYAIMEKLDNIACVPLKTDWSDLGSWDAVWAVNESDQAGNVVMGDVLAQATRNSLALQADGPQLSLVGLDNVIAISTKDAVLVASRERCQDVRKIVDRLMADHNPLAVEHSRVYRPWGWYERLVLGDRYQVKCLMIKPGVKLSLQSHYHRAEHWIVVAGSVLVTRNDEQFLLTENESTYIPAGARHRLENPGKIPAIVIEVQTGSYLGEDDIERYEDDFGRVGNGDDESGASGAKG